MYVSKNVQTHKNEAPTAVHDTAPREMQRQVLILFQSHNIFTISIIHELPYFVKI